MSKRTLVQKSRRGQGLVEYIIIVASVALIALVAVSIFGHKVADQYAIGAGMLPGAHSDDNLPIATSEFAEFVDNGSGANTGNGRVSWDSITGNTDPAGDLDNNVVVAGNSDGEAFVAD